jgi:hypothetical protein
MKCSKCGQTLEEWESGLCEGCGAMPEDSPGKPGEFDFRKLFRFSLAISDNEIILRKSDTQQHNTHKGAAMNTAAQILGTVAKMESALLDRILQPMTGLTDKQKAELSEIVDGAICCADVMNYESVDDMLEEIVSEVEASRDLASSEHAYVSELVENYWIEHGGDDDRDDDESDE